jgi:glutaredoxin
LSPTYSICANDGYINGEVYTCPKCGAATEVYSRITGYYRPVKNWNAGKSQEFKDRKVYNVEGLISRPLSDFKEESSKSAGISLLDSGSKALLFTTKTCPNCKMVKEMLNKQNIPYEVIDADEHADLCRKYNVMQAPTLVMVNNRGAESYANASNIMKYVNEQTRA